MLVRLLPWLASLVLSERVLVEEMELRFFRARSVSDRDGGIMSRRLRCGIGGRDGYSDVRLVGGALLSLLY